MEGENVVTRIRKSCEEVNTYFTLHGTNQKFLFPSSKDASRDDDDFNSTNLINSNESVKLYAWIIQRMVMLMSDPDGSKVLYTLLRSLAIQETDEDWDYHDEENGLKEIKWPARIFTLLNGFCNLFQTTLVVKGSTKKFYETRAILFELFRILLYADERFIHEESKKSRSHLHRLQKECLPLLKKIIIELPYETILDIKVETHNDHNLWLERVAHFYFVEYQILSGGFNELPKEDQDVAKDHSIIYSTLSSRNKELAYYVGFITDCINSVYGNNLTKTLPRCAITREFYYIAELCGLLMEDIKVFSMIKSNEPCWSGNSLFALQCIHVIDMILQWKKGSVRLKEITLILFHIVVTLIMMGNTFFVKKHLKQNQVDALTSQTHPYGDDLDIFHSQMITLMEKLLIITQKEQSDSDKRKIEPSVIWIMNFLRKKCFLRLSSFCKEFENIFVLSNSRKIKHQKWLDEKLAPLSTKAEEISKLEISHKMNEILRKTLNNNHPFW